MHSGIYFSPICATLDTSPSTLLSSSSSASVSTPTSAPPLFADHYRTLGLDHWATSEEIKTAYRQLREEYFNTDAIKYRALQAAYAVLVDWEARRAYDVVYRERLGVPGPPSAVGRKKVVEVVEGAQKGVSRTDSAVGMEEGNGDDKQKEKQDGANGALKRCPAPQDSVSGSLKPKSLLPLPATQKKKVAVPPVKKNKTPRIPRRVTKTRPM